MAQYPTPPMSKRISYRQQALWSRSSGLVDRRHDHYEGNHGRGDDGETLTMRLLIGRALGLVGKGDAGQ